MATAKDKRFSTLKARVARTGHKLLFDCMDKMYIVNVRRGEDPERVRDIFRRAEDLLRRQGYLNDDGDGGVRA
jgi:hypothetical protein